MAGTQTEATVQSSITMENEAFKISCINNNPLKVTHIASTQNIEHLKLIKFGNLESFGAAKLLKIKMVEIRTMTDDILYNKLVYNNPIFSRRSNLEEPLNDLATNVVSGRV